MSMIKKIIIITLILAIAISALITISYGEDSGNFDVGAFETPGDMTEVTDLVNNTSATIILRTKRSVLSKTMMTSNGLKV